VPITGPARWGAAHAARAAPLCAILALALGARLWALWSLRFDGLYGEDPYAYYYHGLALWRDHALSYHWPWLPAPTRLYWPLGEPTLVALFMAAVGSPSVAAALSVSVLAGLGVVALTYLLALRVAGAVLPTPAARGAAALAALLIALAGLQIQAGDTIMADAPALFWGTAALWLWTMPAAAPAHLRPHMKRDGDARRPWYRSYVADWRRFALSALAGACFGLAVSTRFEYAPLLVAMGAYWWVQRRGGPSVRAALLGMLLAGWPQALYSLSYSDPVLHHQWLVTWSPAHFWQTRFATVDGVQQYTLSAGAFYLARPLLSPQSLPATLLPLLPIGALALALGPAPMKSGFSRCRPCHDLSRSGRHIGGAGVVSAPGAHSTGVDQSSHPAGAHSTGWAHPQGGGPPSHPTFQGQVAISEESPAPDAPKARALLLLLLAWWLVPALYLAGVPFESARFALIYAPPLAVLEALGAVVALRACAARAPRLALAAGTLWLVGSLCLLGADARGPLSALARVADTDRAAVRWLIAHVPPGAHIATFSLTLSLYHYGDLPAHRWTLADLSAVTPAGARQLARSAPLVVVADAYNLETQWRGIGPDLALREIVSLGRLRPVAHTGPYTVWAR
jgi:hypothetical protein